MPTLPHTALERRQAADYFFTGLMLAHERGPRLLWSTAAAYLEGGHGLAAESLLMLAAEPFLRRHIYIPGEVRFSLGRLESMFGFTEAFDVISNVFSSFRFRFEHLPLLIRGLNIPESFTTRLGYRFSGEEGMLVMLYRLHFPGTLADMGQAAGRSQPALSECFTYMIEYIYDNFAHLRDYRSLAVHADSFAAYAEAIHAHGAPLRYIFGFIDGKLQHVARPARYQGVLYSGNDRVHGLKWQGIMLPNGMQPYPFGPICGSNHDAEMLRLSDVLAHLGHITQYLGRAYALYGDVRAAPPTTAPAPRPWLLLLTPPVPVGAARLPQRPAYAAPLRCARARLVAGAGPATAQSRPRPSAQHTRYVRTCTIAGGAE